jgi:hypothetical protein
VLLVLPFLIDVAGNAANLYDTVTGGTTRTTSSIGRLSSPPSGSCCCGYASALGGVRLAVGFGAVTAMLWEFPEYYTFTRHSSELRTAYTDTLSDLALGLGGSVLAATITVTLLWSWKNRHTVSQEP